MNFIGTLLIGFLLVTRISPVNIDQSINFENLLTGATIIILWYMIPYLKK